MNSVSFLTYLRNVTTIKGSPESTREWDGTRVELNMRGLGMI